MEMSLRDYIRALERSGYLITDKSAIVNMWLTLSDIGNSYVSAIVLDGPPGTGKTFLAEKTAEILGAEKVFFQCYDGVSKQDLLFELDWSMVVRGMAGQKLPDDYKDMVSLGVLPKAIQLADDKLVFLILDEFDKANLAIDAFLLDFLQSGRLNIPHIGDFKANTLNLVVVITKNDVRELSEPLLRRCRVSQVGFPNEEIETKMIFQHAGCSLDLAKYLARIAKKVRDSTCVRLVSTPELVRLARDVQLLVEEDKGLVFDFIMENLIYRCSVVRGFDEGELLALIESL